MAQCTCHFNAIEISCILTHQFILDRCMEILYIFSGMLVLGMIISILNKGRLYVLRHDNRFTV